MPGKVARLRALAAGGAAAVANGLCGAVAALALAWPAAALAAETGQARLGDDYAQFQIGGADWHPCEHECSVDASCKSWMYIPVTGQCRLKHGVPPAMANTCCVSGVKQAAAAPAPAAKDADETECARLAVAAIDANNDNLGSRCGLTGPLWSSAYDEVFARCLDSSPRRRQRDVEERRQDLQVCKQTADLSGGLVCDHYARMAVAENVTNSTNNCGFTGSEWSPDYEAHRQFCRQAQRAGIADRIAGREHRLEECLSRGGGTTDPGCDAYASQSVSQFERAAQMRCGDAFSGVGWSRDAAEHYRWCRAHGRPEREALLQQRQDQLESCDHNRIDLRQLFKLKDFKF